MWMYTKYLINVSMYRLTYLSAKVYLVPTGPRDLNSKYVYVV